MSELKQVEAGVLSSRVFASARWVAAIAVTLSLWSMWQYPGGTSLNARTSGYSLTQNFLSDLGMTVAYNGQANGLGAVLFVASMLVMVGGFGAVLWQYVLAQKTVTVLAGGLLLLQCRNAWRFSERHRTSP